MFITTWGGEPWFLYDDVLRDDPFPVLDVQVVLAEYILSYPGGSTVWLLKSTNLEFFLLYAFLATFLQKVAICEGGLEASPAAAPV